MSSVLWFLSGGAMMAAVCLILRAKNNKRQRERLEALAAYLEAAGCGGAMTLVPTEDEFSLLEDELYKTVSELRIAREQAQKERHQQSNNLADITHQLKTPLASMSLMTQLLAADATTNQEEYISRIDNQLVRLNWLTGSLLTMSRLDAGVVEFAPVSIVFEELALRAVEPLEQLLQEREQAVHLCGKEVTLVCDAYWTGEVLINLIKNCSEHTPVHGDIILTASVTPLYQQIIIEDNGPGFDKKELPCLFRRFFRGRNSGKDSIGIGLALCRGIMEGQSGTIRAENRNEGGARFVIRFYLSKKTAIL